LPASVTQVDLLSATVEVGEVAVLMRTGDPDFLRTLQNRYPGFLISRQQEPQITFDLEILETNFDEPDADVEVTQKNGRWMLARGDFRAEWDSAKRHCHIAQTRSPHATDSVLRIVHSLVQASRGGFLLHAASAVRNQKAFLFAGESGAGKSTISALAPVDAVLLTDEISYVSRRDNQYHAFGTPFTGELNTPGENVSAPVSALYLLAKGSENRIDAIDAAEAVQSLLSNILFFAKDDELVQALFHSAFEFVQHVPIYRLTFVPDARVWELIG
jgi:hypothetical protein